MTEKEYFRKLDRVYKWYDKAKKATWNQSGAMQLELLKEKNEWILRIQEIRNKENENYN